MSKIFKETLSKVIKSEEYQRERAKINFAAEIQTVMIDKGFSKAKLATLLQEPKNYIRDILSGEAEATIVDMARLAKALDCDLTISLTQKERNSVGSKG